MLYHALDYKFVIEVAIGLLLATAMWARARKEHKDSESRTIRTDYFTTPANSALSAVGIFIPTLAGLFSFLYSKNPEQSYSSLVAAIVFLFAVFILAIWLTFSLLKKAKDGETVTLQFPKDRSFITSVGWIFLFLLLSLFYLAFFLLAELPAPTQRPPNTTLLTRAKVRPGQTRAEVERLWGAPTFSGGVTEYQGEQSAFRLFFGTDGKLQRIEEIKEDQ